MRVGRILSGERRHDKNRKIKYICTAVQLKKKATVKVGEFSHRLWVFGETVVMVGEPIDPAVLGMPR